MNLLIVLVLSFVFNFVFAKKIFAETNILTDCGKLHPVYAVEDMLDVSTSADSSGDPKCVNKNKKIYCIQATVDDSVGSLIFVGKKHQINKTRYYEYMYIYNNLLEYRFIASELKKVNLKKGDIIGCIDDTKNLEYFKVKCYNDCWKKWK